MSAPTPMSVIASEAKFLSVGVFCGLIRVDEVVEWADARFHEQDSPPTWLMDVAFATKSHVVFVITELEAIARRLGVEKLEEAGTRRLLGLFARALEDKRFTPYQITMRLYWLEDKFPSSKVLSREIFRAEVRFRIRWKREGDLQLARRELRRWLEQASRNPSAAN